MTTYTTAQLDEIIGRAMVAASLATDEHLKQFPNDWYPCGFAWVVLRPANSAMAKRLKDRGLGDKAYGGGLQVWNPSKNYTQCMAALRKGADAFAKVISEAGYNCTAYDRID